MRPNLSLSLSKEPKTPSVSALPGHDAYRRSADIPKGIEIACSPTQLFNSLSRPSQVLHLFASSLIKSLANKRIAAHNCLPLIEPLRANLADMIDPHQRARVTPLFSRKTRFRHLIAGHRS